MLRERRIVKVCSEIIHIKRKLLMNAMNLVCSGDVRMHTRGKL